MRKSIALIVAVVLLFGTIAFAEDWICPSCGNKATGNFCNNCGAAYSSVFWTCPQCGNEASGNFCSNCGAKKPEENEASDTEMPQEESGESVVEPDPELIQEPEQEEMSREELLDQYRQVGNTITFGRYEQDNDLSNGQEEIEWVVLNYDKADDKVLLISRYGLDSVPYDADKLYNNTTWQKCGLRTWLNEDFLYTAFTVEEQKSIIYSDVDNSARQGYSGWGTYGGGKTQDYIFLLSYREAHQYYEIKFVAKNVHDENNVVARVAPTQFACSRNQWVGRESSYKTDDGLSATGWWLRSPGENMFSAAVVDEMGSLRDSWAFEEYYVVRPALWLDLKSIEPKDMRYINRKSVQCRSDDNMDAHLYVPASSASILENSNVQRLISSCPAISNNTKNTPDYFNSASTYTSMFESDENKVWRISIQNGVVYFADESKMTVLTMKSKGTPAELIPVIQWEISALEAIPEIVKDAEQLGVTVYAEKRVDGGDYASYADSDGLIDLLDQSKYNGVLKKEHDNLELLQSINAFSGLESLDTNENGQIDTEELFTSNSNSSNGWYVSNDGKYAIRPYNMRQSGNSYLVTVDIRNETDRNQIVQVDLTLKTDGSVASLKSDEAVQDFVSVGNGKYSFKIACDVQIGKVTVTMIQEYTVTIR